MANLQIQSEKLLSNAWISESGLSSQNVMVEPPKTANVKGIEKDCEIVSAECFY